MSATGRSEAAGTGHVRHESDFYSTPPWCTRALLRTLQREAEFDSGDTILDPCAGNGAILREVRDAGVMTVGIELRDDLAIQARNSGIVVVTDDALDIRRTWARVSMLQPTAIITNPPFSLAQPFLERALAEADKMGPPGQVVVAFLLRVNFLGGQKRAAFHRAHRPGVYVLPRRPSFTGGGTDATEYAWFVYGGGFNGRVEVLEVEATERAPRAPRVIPSLPEYASPAASAEDLT